MLILSKDKLTPLHWATDQNHLDIVKFFIEEVKESVEKSTGKGWTPLFLAVYSKNLSIVQYLVGQRANIYAHNQNRPITPFDLASRLKDSGPQAGEIAAYLTIWKNLPTT